RDGVIYVSNQPATLELPAGNYTSYATRGPEWSCSVVTLSVHAGVAAKVAHRLRRELDTRGYVAADTHLHTLQFSGHGDADALERQVTLAGEGVEFAVATDHNHNTDYQPFQERLGLSSYYTSVVGNEVTTEVGHFNGFPLQASDPVPAHDSKDYVAIVDGIRARGAKVVVLNHPRWPNHDDSPFTNNHLDRDTGAFASGLKLTMDATELINSTTSEADPMFVFRDWFALLNRGVRIFAVGTSDSHTVGDPVGQGRTYVASATDDPTKIDVAAVCDAIKNGHTSIGQGIFATVLVDGTARMGDTLDVAIRPDPRRGTDLESAPKVQVELRVQAPSWIVPRKATFFVNGTAVGERALSGTAGRPTDALLNFELACEGRYDRWLVCVVTGDAPEGLFWPTTNPYTVAATNPVFLDVDPWREGWEAPRETAAHWIARSAGNSPEMLGPVIHGVDEAIAVHLLDLFAEKLRAAGTDAVEVRKQVLDLAGHANPAFEGVRRFCARF
ncbi:MAG TPA: CehA/McbA family metallohydrolase, partial [Planctomycetota bacterium]|nr:CehA/McbA family metallohydrolase [Planctomycetota bacterium]